jgi:hypothetical protein
MKNGHFLHILILVGVLLGVSCSQDPIFYKISQETKPLEPRIKGAPTNMTVFEFEWVNPDNSTKTIPMLFVASGRLHWYARRPTDNALGWDSGAFGIPQPGGNVFGLAATGTDLYVLCFTGSSVSSAVVKKLGQNDKDWKKIDVDSSDPAAGYRNYQTIYADSGRVFIGSRSGSTDKGSYAILYLDDTGKLKSLKTEIEVLKGVAWDGANHFLATEGSGIFMVSEASFSGSPQNDDVKALTAVTGTSNSVFSGIININSANIVATDSSGNLYSVSDAGFANLRDYTSYSTGALALWRDPNDTRADPAPKLLLAGRQGSKTMTTSSGYTNGYLEIEINNGVIDSTSAVHEPGRGSNTSASNNERYSSSLGKHPVNFIFQAPKSIDNKMTLFASTQTQGLWSYRERDGEPQWNAEE